MTRNWLPLTRWQRVKQWWCRYAPIPWKKCMVCGRWFFNKGFYRSDTWKWGIPEYCGEECVYAEERQMDAEADHE